jgi:hypothetical protein
MALVEGRVVLEVAWFQLMEEAVDLLILVHLEEAVLEEQAGLVT